MRENGFQADLLVEKTVEDALAALKKQIPRYDGIISIGGDGTLNVVITAFVQLKQSIPLGIIPRGTINNFAKRWNIPNDVDEALNIIVDGQTKKVSIGSCNNEKAIVSSFTIGVLADISNDVRQKEKKKFGLIVYPLAAFRKIGRNKAHSIVFETSSGKERLKVWIALATTTDSVGGIKYVDDDHDTFHISILHDIGIKKVLSFIRYAFTGELKEAKSLTYLNAEQVKMAPANQHDTIYSRIDGDAGPALPLTLNWHKKFLTLFVPKD